MSVPMVLAAGVIDDLFASVGDGKPPDAGEDVEELAQAFDGFRLEEDIVEEEEEGEEEDEHEGEDEDEDEEDEDEEDSE